MIIRDAGITDAEALLAIYSAFVCDSAISFESVPPTNSEMAERISHSMWRWPWLVAEFDGSIAGYSYARPFRSRSAYQFTAESTVFVDPRFQRQGIGVRLMQHLLNRLHSAGHKTVVAGIAMPNDGSVALHERLGFERVGIFPSVGRKFQSWHDVGFWSFMVSDQAVAIPESAIDEWRMRVCPATSDGARALIEPLTAEIAARYDHQGDGSGDFVAEEFDEDLGAFVIGWYNNAPVACGAIRPLEQGVAEVKRMYVVPEHRGRKFSSQILMRLEVEAARCGYHTLRLETGNRQPEAIGLYEKFRFRQIARFGPYVDSRNSLCFEKSLKHSRQSPQVVPGKTLSQRPQASSLDRPKSGLPSIVVIHGGFDGGWAWGDIAAQLRAFGYVVHTPTLTGSGERAHLATPDVNLETFVDDIANVIRFGDLNDVVLVAHSSGGVVAAGVVQRMPERICHTIFLDALVPVDGESVFDILGEELSGSLEEIASQSGCEWKLPHDPPDADRRTAVLLRPMKDRMNIENNSYPNSYIAFTQKSADDPFAPVLSRVADRMQRYDNCRYREADLPHFPMLDQPDAVANLINEEIQLSVRLECSEKTISN